MPDINVDTVRHVANLARLELTADEEILFARQLGQILGFVEQLATVDTEGLEPTAHSVPLVNVLRVDAPHQSLARQDLLAGAPQAESGMFRVPKIL